VVAMWCRTSLWLPNCSACPPSLSLGVGVRHWAAHIIVSCATAVWAQSRRCGLGVVVGKAEDGGWDSQRREGSVKNENEPQQKSWLVFVTYLLSPSCLSFVYLLSATGPHPSGEGRGTYFVLDRSCGRGCRRGGVTSAKEVVVGAVGSQHQPQQRLMLYSNSARSSNNRVRSRQAIKK
jgi:hypothetical protein